MQFTIIIPQPEDAEAVYEIFKQTWLATYPSEEQGITAADVLSRYPENERAATVAEWAKFYQKLNSDPDNARNHVWVAKNESGTLMGVVTLSKTKPRKLGALYVLPEFQGQGVGSSLVERVLTEIGAEEVFLNVAKYNNRAIKFYEKFGFKVVGDVVDQAGQLPSGKVIREVQMFKKI